MTSEPQQNHTPGQTPEQNSEKTTETQPQHLLDGLDNIDFSQPQRVLKRTSPLAFATMIIIFLALAAGVGFFIHDPQSLAKLHGQFFGKPLQIYSLNLQLGPEALALSPGSTLDIHPGQVFQITGLSTNRWQNYDLNLSSPDFPLDRVTGEQAATAQELLSRELFFQARQLPLEVRDKDKLIATFTLNSQYTALDWGVRGDAVNDPREKAGHYRRAFELDPTSIITRDKLAQALMDSDQGPQAALIYETQLTQYGPSLPAFNHLLSIYSTLDDPVKRGETLTKLIAWKNEQGRPTQKYEIALAQIFRNTKQGEKAAAIYEDLAARAEATNMSTTADISIKADNTYLSLGQYLGELVAIYRELNLSDKEINTLKRLVAISPGEKSAALWSEIAALYDRSGDKEGRLEAWETLAGHLPPGPDHVGALHKIGQLATELGHYQQAQKAYQQVLEADPANFIISLNLARLAALAGDQPEYRKQLARTIQLQPDNIGIKKELAQAFLQDDQKIKARDQYLSVLKLKPQDRDTRLALIALLEEIKDKPNLLEQYRQFLKLEPDNQPVAYNLGVMYFQVRQWGPARLVFEKLVEQKPQDQDYRAYLLLCYQHLRQKKEMLAQALILFQNDPSRTVYRDLLLNTYENDKDWQGYTKTAEEITRLLPLDPQAWQILARGQKRLKQREAEAHSLWMFAETTDKNKEQAWLVTARAHEALNINKKALEAYQKILALDPEHQTAAKATLKLKLKELKNKK